MIQKKMYLCHAAITNGGAPAFNHLTGIPRRHRSPATVRVKAVSTNAETRKIKKPEICTADELHYVDVPGSDWKLALWRYHSSSKAQQRNHPLLLLSGVGANAIGFDLSPEASFARFMSGQGFDTWILEVRGSGLSSMDNYVEDSDGLSMGGRTVAKSRKSRLLLSEIIKRLSQRISAFFDEGQNSAIASQMKDLSEKFINFIETQQTVRPRLLSVQDHFYPRIEEILKQLDVVEKNDWDFDHHLEEDLPAAMEYIRAQSKPKDGKLLAIGHSMGGILLYAMLSRNCCRGRDSGLTSIATLGSSLDYTSSRSSLKLLLPVADPAKALNVPVIPMGAMLAAAHPFASRPPYILSWLTPQISAPGMLDPELFEKFVTNSFCTVPSKVLLQLTTAFQEGGLRDRSGSFYYKQHLRKIDVPVLALAGDQDLICPPGAVYETVKVLPKHLVTHKLFGKSNGPHYGHYDLIGGRLAASQVYPCIIDFLSRHDALS